MGKRSTLLLAAAIAALALALAAGIASANRLSVDDQDFTFTYEDGLERLLYVGGAIETTVECEVTLGGSFVSRTFSKVPGATIGHITSAQVDTAGCVGGGDWSFPQETLPWTVTYESFTGTLPTIESIGFNFIDYTYLVSFDAGPRCISRSSVSEPVVQTIALNEGTATELIVDTYEEIGGDDLGGSILCDLQPITMIFWGTAAVEDGTEGTVAFTLI